MREAFAILFMPDGTRYDGKKHIVTDPLNLNVGDKLEGEMFPGQQALSLARMVKSGNVWLFEEAVRVGMVK